MDIVKTTVEFLITGNEIDSIMAAALEGGVTYWCDEVVVPDDYRGEYASEQISRGGLLRIHDEEEDEYYILDKDKFLEGLKKYIEAGNADCITKREAADVNDPLAGIPGIDTTMIDAAAADCIVQYALFQEVVYGE